MVQHVTKSRKDKRCVWQSLTPCRGKGWNWVASSISLPSVEVYMWLYRLGEVTFDPYCIQFWFTSPSKVYLEIKMSLLICLTTMMRKLISPLVRRFLYIVPLTRKGWLTIKLTIWLEGLLTQLSLQLYVQHCFGTAFSTIDLLSAWITGAIHVKLQIWIRKSIQNTQDLLRSSNEYTIRIYFL